MDNADDQLHVDWKRWFQTIANLVAQPLTAGMIPDIPFTKIAMTLSPRLLGRTTAGAGAAEQITVSAPLTLAAGALGLSTPLLAIYGGTGFASYAVGDVLYADTTTTLAKLADVSVGSYLRSGGVGVAPLWSTAKLPNTATTGDLLYASASNVYSNLADVAAGSYLRSGGVTTAPLWSTLTLPNSAATGDLLYASSANTMALRVIGSASDVLTVSGGLPVWAASAPVAATVTITDDTTTNATMFPTWVTANSGNLPVKVTSTKLFFNPSTGRLTLTRLVVAGGGIPVAIGTDTAYMASASSSNEALTLYGQSGQSANYFSIRDNTGALLFRVAPGVGLMSGDWTIGASGTLTMTTGGTGNDMLRLVNVAGSGRGYYVGSTSAGLFLVRDNTAAADRLSLNGSGNFGIGVSPTAVVHMKAGTIAANTAPLKFTSGSLLTTSEAGAVEFLTDDYYATITTGAARKGIVLNNGANLTIGNIPIATTNGRLIDGPTLPLSGANGGTGTGTYAVGDVLYADTTSSLARLADVAVGSYLRSGGVNTAPLWSTLKLPNAATTTRIVYATATDTYGESANLTFNGTVFSVLGFGTHVFASAGTGGNSVNVANSTAGTGNFARFSLTQDEGVTGALYVFSSTYTNSGGFIASACAFEGARVGGLSLIASHASGDVRVYSRNTLAATWGASQAMALTGKVSAYNNVNTAGWGVPAIYGSGRSTAQTAAVASVAAYTVPAADGSFHISANVLVTTATTHNFTVAVDYTDEGNTARTLTLTFSSVAGVLLTAITNVTGAGPYEGLALRIRCKASTAITIKTVGTFTTVTYNVEGMIQQVA